MKMMNKVFITGRLGHEPQALVTETGRTYTRLRIAVSYSWKKEDQDWSQKTNWYTVWVWAGQAEKCIQRLHKGDLLFVEARLDLLPGKEGVLPQTIVVAQSVNCISRAQSDSAALTDSMAS